ncbi:MAG: hypothetical protein J1F33_02465 [Clostridiales bacterium]|nr:hypothetical protein [Clostridiales bacterium]
MAKETKTVQCNPDEYSVNEISKTHESFGWEMTDNRPLYTLANLTFVREKNSPWYQEVAELEKQFYEITETKPEWTEDKPSKALLTWGIIALVFATIFLIVAIIETTIDNDMFYLFFPAIFAFLGGSTLLTLFIVKWHIYRGKFSEFLNALSKWKLTKGKESDELREKAEEIIKENNNNTKVYENAKN